MIFAITVTTMLWILALGAGSVSLAAFLGAGTSQIEGFNSDCIQTGIGFLCVAVVLASCAGYATDWALAVARESSGRRAVSYAADVR